MDREDCASPIKKMDRLGGAVLMSDHKTIQDLIKKDLGMTLLKICLQVLSEAVMEKKTTPKPPFPQKLNSGTQGGTRRHLR